MKRNSISEKRFALKRSVDKYCEHFPDEVVLNHSDELWEQFNVLSLGIVSGRIDGGNIAIYLQYPMTLLTRVIYTKYNLHVYLENNSVAKETSLELIRMVRRKL